jgi:hypothetical protein
MLLSTAVLQGNSCLYVCLPALFDLYMQKHGVFIPSFTAYARTLSSDLALQDRIHTQRFPPHHQKAAAVTFKWPAERQDLPAAEELAELLHLNDALELPLPEAVSGTETGKISWGRNRIQAKPRAFYQQQQQQAPAGNAAGAAAADSMAGVDAQGCADSKGPAAAATAAALDTSSLGADAADQGVQQMQQASGRLGSTSTSSSSSSLQEGQQQQLLLEAPAADAAPAAAAATPAADDADVVQESPFIGKRSREDTPEQQQQQDKQQEQRPAKLPKQTPTGDSPVQANMLTFPRSSLALVTQLPQQQSPPTQRQQTPKQQQALGPGSHLLTKRNSPQHKAVQLLPPKACALPPGMHVQKLRQLQQPPTWLQPYELPPLPPLPPQQQQLQQQLPLPQPRASKPVVKRLPAGMRVGNMSHQRRLGLLTWLLKGRPERMQQLKQQLAAAGAEGNPPKQQQQQLSASQVQMLQASLRKRQQELSQQQQQQQQQQPHAPALRNRHFAASGSVDVKPEGAAAAAAQQGQQQQRDEEDALKGASTAEAQQEVERLQQELQQLQQLLLNQGQPDQQPAAAPAVQQEQQRKRKAAEDAVQQQQQQQGKQVRVSPGRLFHTVLSSAERAEVQALLLAQCALVGAAGAQQLVANIDVQLASSSSSEQQQQPAAACDCSSLQHLCSRAKNGAAATTAVTADIKEEEQQQQQQQQQSGGMNRDVLLALRSLALAFGQQGLSVPSLQDLAKVGGMHCIEIRPYCFLVRCYWLLV